MKESDESAHNSLFKMNNPFQRLANLTSLDHNIRVEMSTSCGSPSL